MTNLVDYKMFLPAIVAAVRTKKKDDNQLTPDELKAVIRVVFRDSVIQFMKDSLLYRMDMPIDVYYGVKNYHVVAPEGYHIEDIVKLKPSKIKIPALIIDEEQIIFACCPDRNIDAAFYAEVALVPKRTTCEFQEVFVDKYYDVILTLMFAKLADMPARLWRSLSSARRYKKDYMDGVNRVKRMKLNNNQRIRLATKRLSSNAPSRKR